MELNELIKDLALRQKKGLHFIMASVVIWSGVLAVYLTNLGMVHKNMLAFCCTTVLMPLAVGLSKLLGIEFSSKSNPLSKAGILFSVNQMLYILIAMWMLAAVPDKMLMVYTMIFGAHLMPFSWLYSSKSYLIFSIAIPLLSLAVGLTCQPWILAAIMIAVQIVLSACLHFEVKRMA